jgi:hypothetical protein
MQKIRFIKLGTRATDSATKIKGTLTHALVLPEGRILYQLQPKGLDDETKQPLRSILMPLERVKEGLKDDDFHTIDVPLDILGSEVEDVPSTFKGTAVSLVYFINGCFHVEIQPAGIAKGAPIATQDFDVRRLKGKNIPKLTEEKKAESQVKKPGPCPVLRSGERLR